MGNGTHENLLHEKILTQIINKVYNKVLFIQAHVTVEYFNFQRENRFKRFAVYFCCLNSVITAAKRLLEEMETIHIWIFMIIPSTTRSISERIPTSNKIWSLIPYLKHCGGPVWRMLGRTYVDPLQKDHYFIGPGYARLQS